jgi:predicted PurR-regulated permease PerM
MLFFLFFAIRDGPRLLATLRALVPLPAPQRQRLFDHLGAVVYAVVYGDGVTALQQGALVGIGFALVGLPGPLVFGVLGVVCALVPMTGTPFIWGPAVALLALRGRWLAAVFLLVWGVGISLIDNFLTPVLISGRAQVDTLTVFIGVLGGAAVFGAVGVVLGPLVLALGLALIRFALDPPPAG